MSALNSRLDKLLAVAHAHTPAVRRYVRLIVNKADEDDLEAIQAQKLDEMVASGEITDDQRDDIDWIVRVIMAAPVYAENPRPKPRDYRPMLTATDIPEPRKRDEPTEPRRDPRFEKQTPLEYPTGFGCDDSKI
jgi:hypothetical protein